MAGQVCFLQVSNTADANSWKRCDVSGDNSACGSTQTTAQRAREVAGRIKYIPPPECEEWSSDLSAHIKHQVDLAPGL